MVERTNKRILGAAVSTAIAAGNLISPTVSEAAPNEHEAALDSQRAALTKVGGHAVKSTNGGTPADGFIPTGCTSPDGAVIRNGSRSRRRVALTFDDGPSAKYTPRILDILDRYNAKGTFFVEGKHVHGREDMLADMLADGHEIANHSYHHPKYPGYDEMKQTNRRIEKATGFKPCLFRPPYGLVNSSVTSAAGRLGMEVVKWDVDSLDHDHPSAGALRNRVVNRAKPGSIILMHDGGHHPQTVKALPGIIRGLKDRGFELITVTEMTGGHYTGHNGRK